MKKLLVLLCMGFLALKAGFSHAVRPSGPSHISFAETGMVVVETGGSHRAFIAQRFTDFVEHGKIPSASGDMTIILSPQEVMTFRAGKLTSYFCGEEGERKCRATVEGDQMPVSLDGVVDGLDGTPKQYSARFYVLGESFENMKAGTAALPPCKLFSIDGIPVSLTYKNSVFSIARGH